MIASVQRFAVPALQPQPTVEDTKNWLLSLGLPPLPVAPAQDPHAYPLKVKGVIQYEADGVTPKAKFTGKNPSYLDAKNVPHTVFHSNFQTCQPSQRQLQTWFANPLNGVGALGNEECIWLDFDVKNFTDAVECSVKAWAIAGKIKELSGHDPTVERTHSEGWRVHVYVEEKPNFTNFALTPGGKHVGEALGAGRFTVLAPTVGVSGQPYTAYHRHSPESKPVVPSLEAIGVYPTGKSKSSTSASTAPTSTPKPMPTPVPVNALGSVSLSQLASPNVQEILRGSDVKDDRSESLATALNELYGWANWCHEKGKAFTENVEALAYEAGERLGIDADRVGRILKTIPVASCTPAAYHKGGDEPCLKHYERLASGRNYTGGIGSSAGGSGGGNNNRRGTGGSGSGGDGGDGGDGNDNDKVVKFPSVHVLSDAELEAEIDQLINQGVTGSALTGKLNRLAAASQIYVGELRKLYFERLRESDLELERDAHQGEIERLLKLSEASLDLSDYLPPVLAEPITLWCEWLSLRPAAALTALLAGVSSLHKVGTELVLHRNQNFRVPPTVYAALVSASGQKKSPLFSNLIRLPLNTLSDEKEDAYQAALEDYEAALEAWEENDKHGDKPEKPRDPTLYYFTNATGEAIPVQAAKAPDKALLALIDELSGLFRNENSYRGGRGSDKQDLLSYFDGMGQTVLRASGVKVKLKRLNLAMFGTIQPEILKRHMEDCSDPDGQWARFLFVNQPLEASRLSDDDGEAVQIHERLTDFYRQIERLPEMEYHLSRSAFKRYQPVYDELERLRVTHPKAGMRAVFAKMEGYIGRLALNLHVLWELAEGKTVPDTEISLFIMEMAIRLAKFYFGQIKILHANSDDDALPTQILKLIELSKRWEANGNDGWIRAQAFREQFASKKRPTGQQAREWMTEAVTMGLGRTRGSGNRLEYHWRRDNDKTPPSTPQNLGNLGQFREDLGKGVPYAESLENKGVADNLGNLGKGFPIFSTQLNVEDLMRQSEILNAGADAAKPEPITPEAPNPCGESSTPTSFKGGSLPYPSLSSSTERSNADVESDTYLGDNLGNGFPKVSLTSLNAAITEDEGDASEPAAPNPNLVGKRIKCVRQGTMYGKVFTIRSQADAVFYWGRHGDHFNCADWEEIRGGSWKILD